MYGLLQKQSSSWELENYNTILECLDKGSPTEYESDKCIAELIDQMNCDVSYECIRIMSPNRKSYGYHLTHKLLYFIIMNQINCTKTILPRTSIQNIFIQICSDILNSMHILMDDNQNLPLFLRDLFLEQMLLCGYIGFAEFYEDRFTRKLILWQNTDCGCYNYYDGNVNVDGRKRRNAIRLIDNCSDHMSGLAAATFSLIIKHTCFEER